MTLAWGTEQPGIHHGLAVADFDGDGALGPGGEQLEQPRRFVSQRHHRPSGCGALKRIAAKTPLALVPKSLYATARSHAEQGGSCAAEGIFPVRNRWRFSPQAPPAAE